MDVIGLPLLAGMFQFTDTPSSPDGLTTTPVGASGTSYGVTELLEAEKGPVANASTAATLNV